MEKLTAYYYDELTKEQQAKIMSDFSESGYNNDYLNDKFSRATVNAQVVVDDDWVLYDIKVFNPYHLVKNGQHLPVYIGPDGWSNWLFDYRDPAGNDVDEILEGYDGVPQEGKFTYDVEFNDDTNTNAKGWHESYQYCKDYIESNNGTCFSYFADYKGGSVSIVCNETGNEVYSERVK
jgi:hypothetical protein